MDMDREGLLNPQGLWNKRGALLGGMIAVAVIVGFNYFYFEQMLGALGLFTAFWLVLLAAVFVVVLAERAAEQALRRLARAAAPSLRAARQIDVGPHLSALQQWLAEAAQPLPRTVRRLQVASRLSMLWRWLAEAMEPLPRAARRIQVWSRLSALRQQLTASLGQWRWMRAAWEEIPSVSRIDEWRRARAQAVRAHSPHHHHRRVA